MHMDEKLVAENNNETETAEQDASKHDVETRKFGDCSSSDTSDNVTNILTESWTKFRSAECGSVLWWGSFCLVTLVSMATRCCQIARPNIVIWDEAHFGKMINHYLNQTFLMDVHPPGGKLLFTGMAYLVGYNGTHPFEKPGASYEGYPEILHIRLGCAILGGFLAPMAFLATWLMTRRLPPAVVAAAMATADLGALQLTRFILLDAPLMFFNMATFGFVCFLQYSETRKGPFSFSWWTALLLTGATLGAVVSIKFTGLFMVAVVGLFTLDSLWNLYASGSKWVLLLKHLSARVVGLILVPVAVYVALFVVHLKLQEKAFTEDTGEFQQSIFSTGFQMNVEGSILHNISQPAVIAYGANITLRNSILAGGYVSTLNMTFPADMGRKTYPIVMRYKSPMNILQVQFPYEEPDTSGYYSDEIEFAVHGDLIRLYHPALKKYLIANDSKAADIKPHRMVYYEDSEHLAEDDDRSHWQLQIVDANEEESEEREENSSNTDETFTEWRTLEDKVRLFNVVQRCFLTKSGGKLPKPWGYHQTELSCTKTSRMENAVWFAEQTFHKLLPNVSFSHLRTNLFSRLVENHRIMTWQNRGFKLSASQYVIGYAPWMWPICYMSHPWYGDKFRITLLGNPIVMWMNLLSLPAALYIILRNAYRTKRENTLEEIKRKSTLEESESGLCFWLKWTSIAYLLHYLPFYTMQRILYYHHYFPALQFSSLLTGLLFGTWICKLRPAASALAMTIFLSVLLLSFSAFSFTAYGEFHENDFNKDNSTRKHLQWVEDWDFI